LRAPPNESRLAELAISFRTAIVRTDRNRLFRCENSPWVPMYGHLGPHSHAWLELGEFQIDITADQFVRDHEKELWGGRAGELREGVMVTSDRSWHWKFEEQIRHSADLSLYDASSQAELEPCYREITGNL
jgi:hypothetical protein